MKPSAEALLKIIKRRMKALSYSYKDAAQTLGVSLPTVKRLFTGDDVPISRLLQLAEWLELTLKELAELLEAEALASTTFTQEQEAFLAKNRGHLAYLFALYTHKRSPREIALQYGLTKASTTQYLKDLENAGFLQIKPGNKIHFRIRGAISWDDRGELGQAYSRHMIRTLMDRVTAQMEGPSEALLVLRGIRLTPESFVEFRNDVHILSRKYELVSAQNLKLGSDRNLVPVTYAFVAEAWEDPLWTAIPNLK